MRTTHPDYCDCVECARERLRKARARVASKFEGRKFVYKAPVAERKPPPNQEVRSKREVTQYEYEEEEYNGINWFKEHLNWALLLAALSGLFLLSLSAYYSSHVGAFLTILVGVAILVLCVEIWYLRQKSRSLWFLFLNLLPKPFDFVILLCLSNRSYYIELVGRNEVLGPFRYIQEIRDWYNTRRDWSGVSRISVICPEE